MISLTPNQFVARQTKPFSALFLLVWLGGWLAGEVGVISVLIKGAQGWPKAVRSPEALLSTLAINGFLALWLALWSLGGIAAIGSLLDAIAGRDEGHFSAEGLRLRRGWWRPWRFTPRAAIVELGLRGRASELVVRVRDGQPITITSMGSIAERQALAEAITRALDLRPPREPQLPPGWRTIEDGLLSRTRLEPSPSARRWSAGVLAIIALGAAAVAVVSARVGGHSHLMMTLVALFVASTVGALSLRLALWTPHWLAGERSLSRQLVGPFNEVEPRQRLERLELRNHVDSDGDTWFELVAITDAGDRSLTKVMGDDTEPRWLGRWLAARTQTPLVCPP